ncbi:Hypothetical predicted protein, partial [Marmota monax]
MGAIPKQLDARKPGRVPAPPTSASFWARSAAGDVRPTGKCSPQRGSAPASWAVAGELGRALGAEA